MERRSAKSGAKRTKYSIDAFQGVQELQDVLSDHEPVVLPADDSGSENEFNTVAEESTDDDASASMDGEDNDVDEDGGDEMLISDIAGTPRGQTTGPQRRRRSKAKSGFGSQHMKSAQTRPGSSGETVYIRGIDDRIFPKSKEVRRAQMYGPSQEDHGPVLQALSKWEDQHTLPMRSEMLGRRMHHSFYVTDDERMEERDSAIDWWITGPGRASDVFDDKQVIETTDDATGLTYMPELEEPPRKVLMGPYTNQKMFTLDPGTSVPLRDAWNAADQSTSYKSGFLMNLGARVQCLDWAMGQQGRDQYLAVSIVRNRKHDSQSNSNTGVSAFRPQLPGISTIQIWRFQAVFQCDRDSSVNTKCRPELAHILCTTWGEIKDIKWSPIRCQDFGTMKLRELGLLACLSGDGHIRVLDVVLSEDIEKIRCHVVKDVAFDSKPPDTVYTCLAWTGGTRLVAGCANGCVAILDLPSHCRSPKTNARPTMYSAISPTYIRAVASGYPSKPHLIFSTDMSGNTHVTDLSQPGSSLYSAGATASGVRNRVPQGIIAWHEFGQLVLYPEEGFTIQAASPRRLFSKMAAGRVKSTVTKFAVSPCHPSLLVGTTGGDVVAMNPTGTLLDGRKTHFWQQTWFNHEWRRPTAQETEAHHSPDHNTDQHPNATSASTSQTQPPKIGPEGLTRIVEGFTAERSHDVSEQIQSVHYARQGINFATIYEEETTITALAWNPNPHAGGWAAAGMGDGLLRVEDIAV